MASTDRHHTEGATIRRHVAGRRIIAQHQTGACNEIEQRPGKGFAGPVPGHRSNSSGNGPGQITFRGSTRHNALPAGLPLQNAPGQRREALRRPAPERPA